MAWRGGPRNHLLPFRPSIQNPVARRLRTLPEMNDTRVELRRPAGIRSKALRKGLHGGVGPDDRRPRVPCLQGYDGSRAAGSPVLDVMPVLG
jgi:hypothetical protein